MEHIRNFAILLAMFCMVLFSAACVGPRIVGENPYNWFPEGVDSHQQNWLHNEQATATLLKLDFDRFPIDSSAHDYEYNGIEAKGVATYAIDYQDNINIPVLVTTNSLLNKDTTLWMFAVRLINGKLVAVQVVPPKGAVNIPGSN